MRTGKFITTLLTATLILSAAPAVADSASDRAATVEMLKQKYVKVLDEQHSTLLAIKSQMKAEPTLLKQVNAVLADFNSNYAAIINGLANVEQPIQPIIDLCQEEVEEFANSIYLLQQMVKKIKTISCSKGKVIKKVSGLAPVCPKGFTKKK
jgi:ABC-type transporter Mla subunit MlaD